MGRIHHRLYRMCLQPGSQPGRTAESADADLAGRQQRIGHAAGERAEHVGARPYQRRGQPPGLPGAAEDQHAAGHARPTCMLML
jgi:hypothetical protein